MVVTEAAAVCVRERKERQRAEAQRSREMRTTRSSHRRHQGTYHVAEIACEAPSTPITHYLQNTGQQWYKRMNILFVASMYVASYTKLNVRIERPLPHENMAAAVNGDEVEFVL